MKNLRKTIHQTGTFWLLFLLSAIMAGGNLLAAQLDWDAVTWTAGSLTNTYAIGGGNVTLTVTGQTAQLAAGYPARDTTFTGGLTPAQNSLAYNCNFLAQTVIGQQEITTIISFSHPGGVTNVSFSLFDIDTGSFTDQVIVTAFNGANVNPTTVTHGSANSFNNTNKVTGIAANGGTSANGNATFTFAQGGITKVVIVYQSGELVNPSTQQINLHDITFTTSLFASNDVATTAEDTVLNIAAPGVLTNDFGGNGSPLRAISATSPSHGTVVLSTNGAYTYTPTNNFNGADSFTYRITDGASTSSTATVSLTVTAVNDAPVANNDSYSVNEDITLNVAASGGVLTNDTDVDGNPLTAVLVATVSHGSLGLNSSGSFTYTPTANYNGPDSFTYRAADAFGGTSGVATVSITVNPVNDAPVANNDSYSVNEDITLNVAASGGVLTNDTDVDGNPLTAVLVATVSHGSLGLNSSGSFTYTPTANYNGPDSFTYRAADAFGGTSGVATVSITINPVNDAPVADAQSVSTPEDTAKGITLTASDVDANPLTYSVVTGPTHGALTGTAPNLTYTPNANYNGPDSFTFKANDGSLDSANATISITVTPVNDAPVADAQSVSTPEDTATPITLTASDVDVDSLTYSVVTGPTHGALTGTAPNLTYTPNANYNGPDSFTFKANDGTVDSANATVSITVTAVNDAPVANDDSYETDEDNQLVVAAAAGVLVNDTDIDGNPLTAVLVNPPAHGTVVLNSSGSFTYTPTADFNGTDSFTYKANDGSLNSGNATVTITVNSVNDTPVANADSYSTPEDTAIIVSAPGVLNNDTDVDLDPLTAILVSGPAHAQSFSFNADGSFNYLPVHAYNGADSFTYAATDGTATSTPVTVTFSVSSVNNTPVANADSYNTDEDTVLSVNAASGVLANDTDDDDDVLTANLVNGPTHGELVFNSDGSFDYTPDPNYNGPDSFTYQAFDGIALSSVGVVSLTVNSVNDTPVANADSYSTEEDTLLSVNAAAGVLANDIDVEGDPLTALLVGDVSHGTLTFNPDGSFDYTPAANYNGADSFTYAATDGTTTSSTVTVSFSVGALNDAPVANNDSYGTDEDTPFNIVAPGVLANDTDTEGDPLTAVLVSGPSHGSVTLNADGSFNYTPDADFNGTDSFTYKANDGTADSGDATVFFTVNAVNDAPTVVDSTPNVDEDNTLNVDAPGVLAGANDVDGDALTAVLITGPSHGALTLNADGSYSYTPAANYNGTDCFTFAANDGQTNSATGSVCVTVNAVNDAPVAVADSYNTNEDAPLLVNAPGVLGNDTDVDGNPLTAVLVTGPSHGSLTLNADGSFSYTPDANYNGADSFSYSADDGTAQSTPVTVSFDITSVNDAPVVVNQTPSVNEDTTLNVSAPGVLTGATDADGDELSAVLITGPSHGALTLNSDGSYTYTPDANYNGQDCFTFAANDGTVNSANGTVCITVNSVNDVPVVVNQTPSVNEDTTLNVSAPGVLTGATDADGDPLTAVLITGPSHGSLTLNADGSYSYTPNANYNGQDCFTFAANDGTANSANGTVCVTVNAVNDAPTVVNSTPSVNEDSVLNGNVLVGANDPDGDPLTAVLITGPSHGGLILNSDGSYTYTPDANYNGQDCFTFAANDGTVNSANGTVCVTVNAVNDAPVANADSYAVTENGSLNVGAPGVLGNDTDIDGDGLSAVLGTGLAHGSLTLNADGSFIYTPDNSYVGADSFTYHANDGTANSGNTTVNITVNSGENTPPIANADSYEVDEDDQLDVTSPGVLGNDTDPQADELTAVLVSNPTHGTLTFNADGSFTYVPADNYRGVDSFTYSATDGSLTSSVATVTINVNHINGAGDIDLLAGSASFSKSWAKANHDRLRLIGRVNPRGSNANLAGATMLITINGVDITEPITLDSTGKASVTIGKTKIKAYLSSVTGKYKFSISGADLTEILGLANTTGSGLTDLDVLLTISGGNFDIPVVGGVFETPYTTTAGKTSNARFRFKKHRTLTGVFNSNKTTAKLGKANGYLVAFRGAIENLNDASIVPTDTIRIQIGDNIILVPANAVNGAVKVPGLKNFRLVAAKHTFHFSTKELNATGIPLPGNGAATSYRLPMMIQFPTGGTTNTFETIIELKRVDGTAKAWKR